MKKRNVILAAAGTLTVLYVGCLALALLTDTTPAPEATATTVAEATELPEPTGTFAFSPTATPAPIPTTTSPSSEPMSTPLSPKRVQAQTVRIIDGDTIEVTIEGQIYKVRYIGIDTPETKHPNKPIESFGLEAAAKNEELVGGKVIELEKDVSETDKYGRLLRYVWAGDLMVNAELVRLGYAQVSTYPPDVKYQDLFLQLQQEAREANRGLWGVPPEPTVALTPVDTPQTAPISPPATGYPYIGNRNTKKFHHASCSSVGQMADKNKVYLSSREEAIASGYVPCKRCNP